MNGSRKGGAYEREVGKKLSLWMTNGKTNNEFIRSVSSGGWANKNKWQVGDLAPNGKDGRRLLEHFGVECKNREEFEWRHCWTSDNPKMFEWWGKIIEEVDEYGMIPMLIYRKNYVPEVIGLWDFFFPEEKREQFDRIMDIKFKDYTITVVPFETFLDVYTPEEVITLAVEWKKQSTN